MKLTPATGSGGPRSPGATLRINEIFLSLQGETSRAGLLTVFVRLTGCPLRCVWCDTEYAFSGGSSRPLAEVVAAVLAFGVGRVCVTGGEPLAQAACLPLLTALCDAGCDVSLETSGALDIGGVDARVSRIVDLKAPASGEVARNHWPNIELLTAHDELKFVLADRADYDWACAQIREHRLDQRCPLLMSPVADRLDPPTLAGWMIADRIPARFQLQLHKQLWGNMRGK
ncbi:7-carboxy-7-deazaguanine synthase QueE [Rhodocyclus tenuis]|uniref:7-carboxy-7-deazaguanine synthase n=1 Tax=Rhodocyclus tenuis TaxID=1066 RepID=A0A840G2F0_RHOTE|nr:7-carboxy-7-deazaguanine synthase QueE [Rhodocyclus tenuis]MBB4246593.1 7-carboxy-7-deazaguanine synthase [Rhodocyclus tenuis]